MYDGVDVKDLLGAYLAGDIRPEERAAVERLLAQDPATREILDGLRDAAATASAAQRPVSANLSRQLQDRLAQLLANETMSAALGAALAGELTVPERELLKRFLREHPRAKSELAAMKATGAWLQTKAPNASEASIELLRQRLNAKLPAHARLHSPASADVSRETTMVKTPVLPTALMRAASAPAGVSATKQKPEESRVSLRVVAPATPWTRRAGWVAAAAAASVAMAFGIARVFAPGETPVAKNKNKEIPSEVERDTPRTPNEVDAPVVRNEVQPDQLRQPIDGPRVPNTQIAVPVREPVAPGVPQPELPRVVDTTPRSTPNIPRVLPRNEVSVPTVAHENKKPETVLPEVQPAVPNVAPNAPVTQDQIANRNTQGIPVATGNSGTAVIPPKPPLDAIDNNNGGVAVAAPKNNNALNTEAGTSNTTTTGNDGVKAPTNETVRDAMVVSNVKGGNVEARPKIGAAQTLSSAQVGAQLASETEFITTSTSRIALDLPEGGKLWLNINTRAKVKLSGSSTTVELSGGQMAYETSRGSLTVVSGEATVTAAKNVDVRIDNNMLIAAVLGDRANVKGKNIVKGQQGSVPLAGNEPTVSGPIQGNVTLWRDGLEAGRSTTGEGKSKSASKSSRKRG